MNIKVICIGSLKEPFLRGSKRVAQGKML